MKQDYTIYLDSYGYMIYVEENEAIGDYALILNIKGGSDWYLGNRVELLFTDGTTKIVTTDKDYNAKKDMVPTQIVTYKVNDDGEYTLKALDSTKTFAETDNTTFKMENDKAGIIVKTVGSTNTVVTANSASQFVVRDTNDTDDYTAYTGIKNAPSITAGTVANKADVDVYYYCKSGKMVTVMFIMTSANTAVEDDSSNALFIAKGSVSNLIHTKNSDYYTFNAVINGEIKEVMVDWNVEVNGKTLASADVKSLNGLFESYSVDKYGVITRLTSYSTDAYTGTDAKQVFNNTPKIEGVDSNNTTGTAVVAKSTIGIDKKSADYTVLVSYFDNNNKDDFRYTITVDDNAKFYAVDEDGNITESSYKAVTKDTNDKVYAVIEDYLVKALVIEDVDDGKAPEVTEGNGTFDVTVSKNQAGELEVNYDPNSFDVTDYNNFNLSWEGTKGKVTVTLVVDGETFTQTTSYKGTQTVQYMLDNAKIPSITLGLASGGVKVKATVTVTFDGMNNDTYKLVGTSGLSILG